MQNIKKKGLVDAKNEAEEELKDRIQNAMEEVKVYSEREKK